MKKGILIASILCCSLALMAQENKGENQQPQETDTVEIKGVHPYKLDENAKGIKSEIAHWSIIPHIGFSAMDGDFTSEMKHNVAIPSIGLGVEYNFTPIWSVGVEYMYDMYNVTGKTSGDLKNYNADTLLTGHMHKAGAYLALDLINLFFPRVQKKIVSIIPYVGGGAAFYKRAKYYYDDKYYDAEKGIWMNPTHGRGNTANYINADGEIGPDRDSTYNTLGYLQAGVNLEFNLNRTLALGLRANYTYFTRDYMDGRGYHKQSASSYASKNNDGIFDITLNMRFKLEAVSKSHPRNMPSFDTFDKMLAAAEPPAEPCHDTIIIRHDSIIVREIIKEVKPTRKEIFNVYFDNDKSTLRQDGLVTVSQVAERMDEDKKLYAVVIGYCDNTGSNGHNFGLGDKRANSVVDELIQEYNIPADHLYGNGNGKLVGRHSKKSYGPNRRAAIHLVDEETFEIMKMQLEDKSANRDESIEPTFENARPIQVINLEEIEQEAENGSDSLKTVPLSESARKEKINEYKQRPHDTITVETGMTLSKLARKYYDNTQCWVFIYAANRDKMATPNDLEEGMEIMIPELTEEELKISVKDCLRLYSTAARNKQ